MQTVVLQCIICFIFGVDVLERGEVYEPQPWQGRRIESFYPPSELRVLMRRAIVSHLTDPLYGGQNAYEASDTIAERTFSYYIEAGLEPPFGSGDLVLEISKMNGTGIRMAPNNEIFINHDYLETQSVE